MKERDCSSNMARIHARHAATLSTFRTVTWVYESNQVTLRIPENRLSTWRTDWDITK